MKYRYLVVMVLGAVFGILQGIGNAKSQMLAIPVTETHPILVYVLFGGAGVLGIFLKPPRKNALFIAFASSLIVFSGCVSFLMWLNSNLSGLSGIMSIGAIGLGSGMFFRTARMVYLEFSGNET